MVLAVSLAVQFARALIIRDGPPAPGTASFTNNPPCVMRDDHDHRRQGTQRLPRSYEDRSLEAAPAGLGAVR
jgi:hypothetical protein